MKTAFVNGILLDGMRDMVPVAGKAIIVENETICAILPAEEADLTGCEVIDLQGQYLLPGLINLHVHTAGSGKPAKRQLDLPKICRLITSCAPARAIGKKMVAGNVYTALMAGVTTIRAVGGIADFDSRIRDEICAGKRIGPRMLVADAAISVEGGHMTGSFSVAAHSAEEAAQLVDEIAKNKPDLIKLMITGGVLDSDEVGKPGKLLMPPEYVKAACNRAHALGYQVAAHTEGADGVRVALENGVDTIEHGSPMDEELSRLFRGHKAAQVLTLSPAIPFAREMPGVLGMSEIAVINSRALLEGMVAMAKENLKNGVPVGLGTDASCSYCLQSGMWRELVYFAKYCGVSPAFALHTATAVNAEIAGIGHLTGTITPGKSADMIAVKANPLEDLTALRRVSTVVMAGKIYRSPDPKQFPEVEAALDAVL